MPVPKIAFKSTVLDLELENVEITVGTEIMRVGHLKASLDVADLLRVQLPELMRGEAMGVMLLDHGVKKIQCIKEVRAMTNWGLREAKIFVESDPILLKACDMEFMPDADLVTKTEEAARILKGCGASVEICYGQERIPTVLDRFREILVEALGRRTNVSPSIAEE
jgi:ribosomal protein L7/L12